MNSQSHRQLVNAAGQLLQQHAFDHLSDEKLVRMNSCLHRLGQLNNREDLTQVETELLTLCEEANLYVETTTPQSLQQWYTAMSYFGRSLTAPLEEAESI